MKAETFLIIFTGIIILLATDCKKEESAQLPDIATQPVTDITATSAISGGTINSDGDIKILSNGVCWNTSGNPSIADSKTIDTTGIPNFTSSITGLNAGTIYHVRAYATNSAGTAYGNEIAFTTLGKVPTAVAQPASNISRKYATLNGTVNANDVETAVTFEYGTSTIYTISVAASPSPVSGNTGTNVSTDIQDLTPGTAYHFRVKTLNTLGTVYADHLQQVQEKVYESMNYQNDWDGKDTDGNMFESNTYWYVIHISGLPSEFKGFVYLKR